MGGWEKIRNRCLRGGKKEEEELITGVGGCEEMASDGWEGNTWRVLCTHVYVKREEDGQLSGSVEQVRDGSSPLVGSWVGWMHFNAELRIA